MFRYPAINRLVKKIRDKGKKDGRDGLSNPQIQSLLLSTDERSTGLQPRCPRLQAMQSQKKRSLLPKTKSTWVSVITLHSNLPMPFPSKPGSLLLLSTHRRESGSTASASPARALPRPPSGRVGPAPAPPGPAEPRWALTFPAPPWRAQARVGGVSAGTASPARPRASPPPRPLRPALTFVGGRGRQAPPRGGGLRGLRRALSHAVLHQLEVRRVERVMPRERRDGREHGDLRRARRAERRRTRKPYHDAAAEPRPCSREATLPPRG